MGKTGPSGYAPSLSALRWNQRWICWRCGCIKGPGQKIIVPIITKTDLDNLQWLPQTFKMQFQCVMWNNKALIHLNCQYQHSLQSSIPITKTCQKWVMTLSSSMAMYSVMRDIPDARKVPMERGWVALYLYATCKFSNLLTLEQWAFEYGLPLFWYALYIRIWRKSIYECNSVT